MHTGCNQNSCLLYDKHVIFSLVVNCILILNTSYTVTDLSIADSFLKQNLSFKLFKIFYSNSHAFMWYIESTFYTIVDKCYGL
jgi:hypothetical protein